MKLSLGLLSPVWTGAILVAAGCSGAPPPAAQSAGRAEPSAAAPAVTGGPNPAEPRPFHLIEFVAVGRGDRVADLGPGRGYSITPLSNAVGPFGAVYVRHDPAMLHTLPSEQDSEGPVDAVPANVIRMDTPLEAPFSPEAKNLDCATFLFTYHDLIAEQRDRRSFNAAVFHALKPGGCYVIAEHASAPDAPAGAAQNANRIDAGVIRAEVEAAGFRFVEAADFLPQPAPTGVRPTAGGSQYVLKFQKPPSR